METDLVKLFRRLSAGVREPLGEMDQDWKYEWMRVDEKMTSIVLARGTSYLNPHKRELPSEIREKVDRGWELKDDSIDSHGILDVVYPGSDQYVWCPIEDWWEPPGADLEIPRWAVQLYLGSDSSRLPEDVKFYLPRHIEMAKQGIICVGVPVAGEMDSRTLVDDPRLEVYADDRVGLSFENPKSEGGQYRGVGHMISKAEGSGRYKIFLGNFMLGCLTPRVFGEMDK